MPRYARLITEKTKTAEPVVCKKKEDVEYYGPVVVWQHCHYSGQQPKDITNEYTFERTGEKVFTCPYCDLKIKVKKGEEAQTALPEHERALDVWDQARNKVEEIAVLLGFDRWDRGVSHAMAAATDRNGATRTVDSMVAIGMAYIQQMLMARGASVEAAREMSDLLSFRLDHNDIVSAVATKVHGMKTSDVGEIGDDWPFFSEGVLYPLLGKDMARTVLSYVNSAAAAVGASPRGDDNE